ncbi:putative serine hydrolase [Anticarsia gemmatalis]|uniref:putative serine hydrolase n=1 Tax=Anticarsia gemmatalis TaxID=129554 RepID=UPI003F76FD8A
MAKRLVSHLFFNTNELKLKSALPVLHKKLHTQVPTKEIQIPVKCGHISAKLWGNSESRPILALHGWQDNAGTWDPIAPMLAKDRSILAIDFPGHGLSSWIPPGMMYYQWELPRVILYLKQYFQWDKVSILSHSMGAIAGMRFSCLYPDDVDFYIAIDSLIYDDFDLNLVIDKYPSLMEKGLIAQSRLDKEPPSYSLEEIKQLWHRGTNKSVSLESVQYLMERGVKQSKKDPTKYYISRDSRLKYVLFNPENKQFVEALVKRLKCPTLYVKAIDSPYSADEYSTYMREVVERNNENFELHFVPGTHHVHLNDPNIVAPLITNFLKKHNFSNA